MGSPIGFQYHASTYASDVFDVYWYEKNLQGDIVAVYDQAGNMIVSYRYDAWGNCTKTNIASSVPTAVTNNPFRYRGYYYDVDLELYYLNSRYYDANTGRFISADGYVSTGQGLIGYNMYAYCGNNPITYTDYTGCYPLQAAFELLKTWVTGDGSIQDYSEGSRIVKKLKKSKKMKSYVESAIDNYGAGQSITSGSGEFTSEEDGYELYLSTQHFDYTIVVTEETRTKGIWWWKHKEKRYTATVIVSDTYNFDNLREWDGFGNIMNNIAYLYHALGGGNDYEWSATYKYSTKWSNVN